MEVFFYLLVGVLGLCLGSFLSVFTYRKQRGMGFILGRSICPRCKNKILWFDNVPVFSFLFLKGRCRKCNKKISLRYPLIEIFTAFTFLLYLFYFSTAIFLFWVVVISILIAIFVIDLESKMIPDELVLGGILFVSAYILFSEPSIFFERFMAGFMISAFFLLIHLLTKGRGMGLGDVKFVILGGLLLDWPQAVIWLFLSFASGAVVGIFLILLKKAKFGREIPFGPFLAGSLLIAMLYGEKLLKMYLK